MTTDVDGRRRTSCVVSIWITVRFGCGIVTDVNSHPHEVTAAGQCNWPAFVRRCSVQTLHMHHRYLFLLVYIVP